MTTLTVNGWITCEVSYTTFRTPPFVHHLSYTTFRTPPFVHHLSYTTFRFSFTPFVHYILELAYSLLSFSVNHRQLSGGAGATIRGGGLSWAATVCGATLRGGGGTVCPLGGGGGTIRGETIRGNYPGGNCTGSIYPGAIILEPMLRYY